MTTSRNAHQLRQLHRAFFNQFNDTSLYFLIGQAMEEAEEEEDQSRLIEEIELYNDFIIGDFVDKYDNLKYKTLTGYNYVRGKWTFGCNCVVSYVTNQASLFPPHDESL